MSVSEKKKSSGSTAAFIPAEFRDVLNSILPMHLRPEKLRHLAVLLQELIASAGKQEFETYLKCMYRAYREGKSEEVHECFKKLILRVATSFADLEPEEEIKVEPELITTMYNYLNSKFSKIEKELPDDEKKKFMTTLLLLLKLLYKIYTAKGAVVRNIVLARKGYPELIAVQLLSEEGKIIGETLLYVAKSLSINNLGNTETEYMIYVCDTVGVMVTQAKNTVALWCHDPANPEGYGDYIIHIHPVLWGKIMKMLRHYTKEETVILNVTDVIETYTIDKYEKHLKERLQELVNTELENLKVKLLNEFEQKLVRKVINNAPEMSGREMIMKMLKRLEEYKEAEKKKEKIVEEIDNLVKSFEEKIRNLEEKRENTTQVDSTSTQSKGKSSKTVTTHKSSSSRTRLPS